jgi:glycosyltransferase involved in cell wall biosynthesis
VNKNIRVLFYAYEYPPLGGGVANAVENLFEQFSKEKDLHIDFITSSLDNKWEVDDSLYSNITFYKIPVGKKTPENYHKQKAKDMVLYSWNAFLLTWKLIFKHKYNLAHFFGFPGGLVTLLFRWKMHYIISLRGVDVPGYNDRFGLYYKLFYTPLSWLIWQFADKVIANSKGLADLANQTSKKSVNIIPNGVDISKFQVVDEKEKFENFTVTGGATLLGRKKGLEYLIRGFAKLNKEFPDTRLKLIGSGDLWDEFQNLINELNIEKSAELLGRKEHKWIEENLPKFHALCLPSLNEGMSNAALEGLASGLPLILTNTGGTEELLVEGENGFIVEKKNPDDIYDKLRKLYQDAELRKRMGENSRKRAESMSWESVAREYLDIYRKY